MLISSTRLYPNPEFFSYCREDLSGFLGSDCRLLFVPFAYADHKGYTAKVAQALRFADVAVSGSHDHRVRDATELANSFDAVFCGGGNTFLLLRDLYSTNLINIIPDAVRLGVKYMGSSAGANVACPTISTTNDMPIVEPPSLNSMNLVPFNINPHYFDTPPEMKTHMGETRRDRIEEFLRHNAGRRVLALREGSYMRVDGKSGKLMGDKPAIIFEGHTNDCRFAIDDTPLNPGADLSMLWS